MAPRAPRGEQRKVASPWLKLIFKSPRAALRRAALPRAPGLLLPLPVSLLYTHSLPSGAPGLRRAGFARSTDADSEEKEGSSSEAPGPAAAQARTRLLSHFARALGPGGRDETCPVSTGGGARGAHTAARRPAGAA